MAMFEHEELDELIDSFESAVTKAVCAEVDAGCCRTRMDFERADTAREQAETARAKLQNGIVRALTKGTV